MYDQVTQTHGGASRRQVVANQLMDEAVSTLRQLDPDRRGEVFAIMKRIERNIEGVGDRHLSAEGPRDATDSVGAAYPGEKAMIGDGYKGNTAQGLLSVYGVTGTMLAERINLQNIDDLFAYQEWDLEQRERGNQVRELLVAAAKGILRLVPESPRRTKALQLLVDARMDVNAAISFRGRF